VDAVEVNDGVDRVERTGLPGFDLLDHRVGDGRDQAGRDFHAVDFFQMALDLAHRHATGIQRENLLVEARPAGLVFGDDLRLEGAVAIAWNFNRQLAKVALQRLFALAVAGVAGRIGDGLMFVVTEVFGHFGFEGFLDQQLGQLLEQAVLADQVFGFLVVAEQLGNEFIGDGVFFGRHVDSGQ